MNPETFTIRKLLECAAGMLLIAAFAALMLFLSAN